MKGVVLFASVVLAAVAFAALSRIFIVWGWRALVIVPVLGLFWGVPWLFRRYEWAKEGRAAQGLDKRFRELSALASSPNFELNVSGSSYIYLVVLVLLSGAFLLYLVALGERDVWFVIGGGLTVALGLMGLWASVPTLGKPKISITRLGFKTPSTPLIPWKLVQGIHLQEITYHRGSFDESRLGHYLEFCIPSLPQQRLRVVLRNPSEHPEVIRRLVQHLWTAATGSTHVWFPGMSNEYNEAERQLQVAEARFFKEALAGPSAGNDAMKEVDRASLKWKAALEAERRRERRRDIWWGIILIPAMVLWILWPYLKIAFP